MKSFRGTLSAAFIGACCILLPADRAEAGLIDWLRCVLHPFRVCGYSCAPVCEVPAPVCPPVVQEGSYYDPCNPCPPAVTVSYVRRTYLEPRTRMTSQTVLEPQATYVRRKYWDPCSRCYKTYFETGTSYVKRRYCVPVTDYVERSYLTPVTSCVTPTCPPGTTTTDPAPVPADTTPATSPGAGAGRATQPQIGGPAAPRGMPGIPVRHSTSTYIPARRSYHPPLIPGA